MGGLGGSTPSTRIDSWGLLGYDVSDEELLSGLMNSGFDKKPEDVQSFRDTSVPHMNTYHLFDSVEPAAQFIHHERVQEHAPFFIFGIWLIKKEL